MCSSIMEDNIEWDFLYWDDYEDENLPRKKKNDKFSDSLEDED